MSLGATGRDSSATTLPAARELAAKGIRVMTIAPDLRHGEVIRLDGAIRVPPG